MGTRIKPVSEMSLEEAEAELSRIQTSKPAGPKPVSEMSLEEAEKELLQIEKEKVGPFGAALVGTAQGLTFGFSDELKAAMRAAGGVVKGEGEFKPLFEKFKQEERELVSRAREQRPITTGISQVAGAIPVGMAAGVGGGLAAGLGRAAAMGGLAAAGESEESIGSREIAGDIVKGATIGAVSEGVFRGIGKALKSAAPTSLKKAAEERAVKALRPLKKVNKSLEEKGRLHEIGRRILDEKILSLTPEKTLQKSKELREGAGEAIGKAVKDLDEIVNTAKKQVDAGNLFDFIPDGGKSGFLIDKAGNKFTKSEVKDLIDSSLGVNMKNIADKIRKDLVTEVENNPPLRGQLNRLKDLADDFEAMGTTSFDRARKIKTAQGKLTNFDTEAVPQKFRQKIYTIIRKELEDSAGKLKSLEDDVMKGRLSLEDVVNFNTAKFAESPDELLAANKLFGDAIEIEGLAKNLQAATQTNRDIGLRDVILASGGFAALGPQGLALGLATNLSRKYGSSSVAIGLDKLAKAGSKVTQSRFGQILEEAAKKSPNAFIATHLSLMSNEPEYRELLGKDGLAGAIQDKKSPMLGGK